jgi:hypothetical protein
VDGTGHVAGFAISIVNMGQAATRVRTNFEMHGVNLYSEGLAMVRNQDRIKVDLQLRQGQMALATIDFVDSLGMPGTFEFEVRAISPKRLEFGEVQLVR